MSTIYNPSSTEKFSEAKIINGNPNGIINFNDTPHKWAVSIYNLMGQYTWFTKECGLAQDKTAYANGTDSQRYTYDMALAQLITNDSVQTKQLVDSIAGIITSPVVNACIDRQAYEESLHSQTYSVAADEVCQDSNRIYTLYETEPALARKNNAVAAMYEKINQEGTSLTDQEKLLAFVANQILEELVFPGGFIALWSLGWAGTCKAISFIERDESGTHVPLFKNIFNTAVRQVDITDNTVKTALSMITHMAEEEKIWTKHITKGSLGFSDKAIDLLVEHKANSVCTNLRLPLQYAQTDGGPLMAIHDNYSMLSKSKTKSNFFEVPVGDYAIGGLDEDY